MKYLLLDADGTVLLVLLPVVIVIVAGGYFFSKKMTIKRGLRKAAGRTIAEFMDGEEGRVTGNVLLAGKTLTAPLSMRTCAYYHIEVQEYQSSGKSGHWHTVIEEEETGHIILDDGTGYALIDTSQMKAYLVEDVKYESGTFNDATPELESFLQSRQKKSTGFLGWNKSMRYREGILEANEVFTVSGVATWSTPREHGLSLNTNKLLVISATDKKPVLLTDDPSVTKTDNNGTPDRF